MPEEAVDVCIEESKQWAVNKLQFLQIPELHPEVLYQTWLQKFKPHFHLKLSNLKFQQQKKNH